MKFLALLRGINVGGNNKVSMLHLRECFQGSGFKNVVTYINSGNVIFESKITNKVQLVKICENAIKNQFGFHVICSVITAKELINAVNHAPKWWDQDKDSKHNAIFVIAPKTAKDIIADVGDFKPQYESVEAYDPIIFWSAPLQTFGRTRYNKIVGTGSYKSITIRNSNTTKKLAELCGEQ